MSARRLTGHNDQMTSDSVKNHTARAARTHRRIALFASLLLSCGLSSPARILAQQPAAAAREKPVREQTALRFIPDDAAFYGSSLRLKQQFTNLITSKAFARISSLPAVKSAVEEIKGAWSADAPAANPDAKPAAAAKNDAAKTEAKESDDDGDEGDDVTATADVDVDWSDTITGLKAFWSNTENQQLVGLALDALSNEIFFYGDNSIIGFLKQLQSLNGSFQGLGTGVFGADGPDFDFSPDDESFKVVLDLLEKLPVPAMVIGFKLNDPAPAKAQLARLEKALRQAMADYPNMAKGLRREKMGSSEYLTLKLDGSQIPWDELLSSEDDKPDADKKDDEKKEGAKCGDDDADDDSEAKAKAALAELKKRLKSRSLTISIGIHENYLLFSFGETNAHLLKFAGKGKRLVDRPELAPLLKLSADKPLTGISYVSQELSAFAQTSGGDIDQLKSLVEQWGEQIGLDEEAQQKFISDMQSLKSEGEKLATQSAGAVTEWQYLTPRGYEGYSYDFGGGDKSLDGSKKLSILEHLGGDPLVIVADRRKGGLERYQFAMKVFAAVAPHLDVVLTKNVPEPYGEQYAQVKTEFAPILAKFDTITRTQLLPALADGQSAFVLDARLARKQWHEALPPSIVPLEFPSPALIYGVSDAKLLKTACGGYFGLLQETVNALSKLYPEQVPAIPLPPPTERDASGGKLYVYAIPGAEEGPEEIAPTGALGTDVAVLSLVPAQAKRLLTKTKFAPTGVLARSAQPAAQLWYVNFAGLVDMASPWVHYGVTLAATFMPDAVPNEVTSTLTTVFDVLKCWRGTAGITYVEGKALVEFSESLFEDVK